MAWTRTMVMGGRKSCQTPERNGGKKEGGKGGREGGEKKKKQSR